MTAAATVQASAKAGPTTQPKTGNTSAAPPVAKPSPSSPSKGKFGRGSKHQPKPPSTSPGQAASTAPSYSSPPADSGIFIKPAPAPSLAPESSAGSGRRSRPVLGLVSRQFEEALVGAGVSKDGSRLEHAAERGRGKGKEKEWEPAKDGPSSSKREGKTTTQGHGVGLLQLRSLGPYPLLQTLQRGAKQALPRTS